MTFCRKKPLINGLLYNQVSTAFRGFGNFKTYIARVLSPMRPYQALTNNSPKKGPLQDIKNFHFLSCLPKKVDWSLSPPSSMDSFCRVSSPLICHQQSSGEETPWPQGMVYFYFPQPLSWQQLDGWGWGHLHDNDNDNVGKNLRSVSHWWILLWRLSKNTMTITILFDTHDNSWHIVELKSWH